ncbi:MAG: YbaB/EbfC family nucleoid-associated protein [Planctomycetota bacterium]|nr:YbaB/EbfC family nucleoid-associated protein [Planctomycetota bacterium]
MSLNFDELMRQAKGIQQKIQKLQNDLAERVVEGSAGGGMVKAYINGKMELLKVKIEPEVVDPNDVGMLEDLIVAAFTDGTRKAKKMAEEELARITGGLPIPPGMFSM